jgi:hypothetical protein
MGDQASDCRAAGMICTQDLTQKDPQRDQWRIDPVQPARADRCQRLSDEILRENVAERQVAVLEKLPSKKTRLLPKPSLVRIRILGLLAGDGSVAKRHLRKRGLFAYVISRKGLAGELRAIRHIDCGVSDR